MASSSSRTLRLDPSLPVYWFFLQIGMVIGIGTAWPMNE